MLAIAFHKPISATKARAILKVLNCLARKKFIFKHAGAGENHAWSSEPGIWQVVCKTMPAGHSVYENLRGIVSPDASSSIVSGNLFRKGVSKTTMTTAPRGDRWYALQLRTRWESSTATLLSNKGYEIFLPTFRIFKTRKPGHGRPLAIEGPLFPGYVFCRFDAYNRLPVLVTPGVIAVVGRGRIPIPVEDSEIDAIQTAVSAGACVEPCPYPEVGQLVRIEEGALTGVEGILTRYKGTQRIILSVSLLRRSVAVEIDRSAIRPIQLARTPELRHVNDSADPRTDRRLSHEILSLV